jgi:predicted DNA-binding helix-hairpin-helix protein
MNVHVRPDSIQKLAALGEDHRFEPAGDRPATEQRDGQRLMPPNRRNVPIEVAGVMSCISEVTTPTGKMPVLKAMVTTACERNCFYCPFRAGRSKIRRVIFQPDELAKAFDAIQHAGLVKGLFLSSGIIKGGVTTQDRIIDTVEIVRDKYAYDGYIHLKIMPGAERDQIVRAMQLADRVSINLEGATAKRLNALAPKKKFYTELLQRLRWTHEIREQARHEAPGLIRASAVTQFVVGAVGDTDLELLSISDHLYHQFNLSRVYYSPFRPLPDTPFENLPPTPLGRDHRLYQASFLLRDYAWDVEELPFTPNGNLPLNRDPKAAWAEENLCETPVEVNLAPRRMLLRVPGIGPKSADTILAARRRGRLTELAHLRSLGIRDLGRIAPYILLDGHQPPQQLPLFELPAEPG